MANDRDDKTPPPSIWRKILEWLKNPPVSCPVCGSDAWIDPAGVYNVCKNGHATAAD